MDYSERLKKLPPYIFVEIDKKKKKAIEEGREIINLGIGDPDRPTPEKILNYIKEASYKSENHKYPIGRGSQIFKDAIITWMDKRFNVGVKNDEIVALIGAKDGITHLPLAFVNPGDIVLIPDPGYPGYLAGTLMAGGEPYFMPLKEENGFLPDLSSIPKEIYKKTKIMWLNYPNNPTSAIADYNFYEEALSYAEENSFIIAQDAAYSETYFKEPPISILEIEGAKKQCIEFFSMSKTYNMTGWRVGFAVGDSEIINGLATVKENMDSGTVCALQEASANTLLYCDKEAEDIRNLYKKRASAFYIGLKEIGYEVFVPVATLYLWVKVPGNFSSLEFANLALDNADIIITPGIGFGKEGDKYFRIALTVEEDVIEKALKRFKKLKSIL